MNASVRISELIEHLTACQARYGDCPVYVENTVSGWTLDVESVEFGGGDTAAFLMVEVGCDDE